MNGLPEHPVSHGGRLKRMTRKTTFWIFRLAVLTASLLALFVVLTPQGRTGFHTALFVLQVLDMPVKPLSWFTDEPLRHEVYYQAPDGTKVAEVYRVPDGKPRAAVLLSLGITDQGFNDRNAINLGKALARVGYVVMFQWSPGMGLERSIDPTVPDNLVSAFRYLEAQDYVDSERVGLGGFCVGASFALIAAADAGINDRVHFVNALGPYYDAETLLLQAASRSVVYRGEHTPWQPKSLTMRVFANELIRTLDHPHDVELLTRHYLEGPPAGPEELNALSRSARQVVQLMDGVEPNEANALYATLPADFHEFLAEISPSTRVADIKARLLVMHDRNDLLVPAAESRRLVEATQGRTEVHYTELLAFDHITPSPGSIFTLLGQAARLYRHMYAVIRIAS